MKSTFFAAVAFAALSMAAPITKRVCSIPPSLLHPQKKNNKKLTNKTAMLHRRQRNPKMRLYSTSMYFPSRRYHHLHLPRLLFLRSRTRKRKRRSSNRKLNPSSYLFRFFFYSSNKKTMLHQQIRSTDLRGKSYVYDSRGWDGGLCLKVDAWSWLLHVRMGEKE